MSDYDEFFNHHYVPVVRSLTLALGDREAAQDAAQVGFERAYRKWRIVSSMDRPATWVFVVAVRDARRTLRREERRVAFDDRPDRVASPESRVVDASWIDGALSQLPPRQRATIVLRHLAGLSLAEVSDAMGVTVGTVKSTLHAAYRALRVELNDERGLEEVNSDAY